LAYLFHLQLDAGDLAVMLAAEVISAKFGASQGGEWRRFVISPNEFVSMSVAAGRLM
jgi:hypothetical protein